MPAPGPFSAAATLNISPAGVSASFSVPVYFGTVYCSGGLNASGLSMSASYNWTFNDNLVDPTGLDLWQCQCAATVSGTATLDGVSGFQLNAQAELSAAPLQISDIANYVIGGNGWDYYCVADSPSECPSGPSYPLGVTYLGSLGGAATVDSNGYLDFTVYVVGVPYTLSIYI